MEPTEGNPLGEDRGGEEGYVDPREFEVVNPMAPERVDNGKGGFRFSLRLFRHNPGAFIDRLQPLNFRGLLFDLIDVRSDGPACTSDSPLSVPTLLFLALRELLRVCELLFRVVVLFGVLHSSLQRRQNMFIEYFGGGRTADLLRIPACGSFAVLVDEPEDVEGQVDGVLMDRAEEQWRVVLAVIRKELDTRQSVGRHVGEGPLENDVLSFDSDPRVSDVVCSLCGMDAQVRDRRGHSRG